MIKNSLLYFEPYIPKTPFYKRRLFIIGVGGILSITIVIIVIVICSSKSSSKSKPIKFYYNSFVESKEFIRNPDQGYYSPVNVILSSKEITYENNRAEQLYHLRCDLSEFSGAATKKKDKEISKKALD